ASSSRQVTASQVRGTGAGTVNPPAAAGTPVNMTDMQPGVGDSGQPPATDLGPLTGGGTPTPCPGAFHYLQPEGGAPPNGGRIEVGRKFTLDMMISAGDYSVGDQEAYSTLTSGLLQNVNVQRPGCVLTSTVTGDYTVFDFD